MRLLSDNGTLEKLIPKKIRDEFSDEVAVFSTDIIPDRVPEKSIAVAHNLSISELVNLFNTLNVQHIIQSNSLSFLNELQVAADLLVNPSRFLKDPSRQILGRSAESYSVQFNTYSQKASVIEQIQHYLKILPGTATVVSDVLLIADELFTNALFNTSEIKKRPEKGADFHSAKTSEIFLQTDFYHLVIGCRDRFGTIDPHHVISRIQDTYAMGISQAMRMARQSGAGLGLRLVLDYALSFYVVVSPNKETVVCCTLPLRHTNIEKEKYAKNIHCSVAA